MKNETLKNKIEIEGLNFINELKNEAIKFFYSESGLYQYDQKNHKIYVRYSDCTPDHFIINKELKACLYALKHIKSISGLIDVSKPENYDIRLILDYIIPFSNMLKIEVYKDNFLKVYCLNRWLEYELDYTLKCNKSIIKEIETYIDL